MQSTRLGFAILHSLLFGIATSFILTQPSMADESTESQKFENPSGWAWIVPPIKRGLSPKPETYLAETRQKTSDDGWKGFIVLMEEGKDRELILVFARRGTFQDYYDWHPIAFDIEGKRHLLRPRVAAGNFGVMLERWSSNPDTLPASKVAYVGLEGLTAEGFRKAAEVAAKRAKEQGLEVLPFPTVGKPYAFKLTDVQSKIIDANDLRGKVVLLDLWATWCFPCMKKMPMLKELYAKHHAGGFEIVGINFDQDQQTCLRAVKELDIPWQQVMAPTEEATRDIWMRAMGVQTLPRLLLIDREGKLRDDCKPDELESRVTKLMSVEHEGNEP